MKSFVYKIVMLLLCCNFAYAQVGEYYFDTDPGPGLGISFIPTTAGGDSVVFAGAISVPSLSNGHHKLCMRFATAVNGNLSWSIAEEIPFFIYDSNKIITAAEYFFDTDPGIGNGISLSLNSNLDTANYIGNISTSGLNVGAHRLYMRTRDLKGNWSLTDWQPFYVYDNNTNMANGEYFFDADPAAGNGTPINFTNERDSAFVAASVSTLGLLPGQHTLSTRAKDKHGKWSNYETVNFYINNNPITAEYFVDTDPGIGNGLPINLTSTTIGEAEFSGLINLPPNVGTGAHKLYIRALDAKGQWGLTDSASFVIQCDKWFADSDGDGFGNPNDTVRTCIQPSGYVNNGLDCNDLDALEKPNQTWYIDADNDDFGTGITVVQCTRPPNGFVAAELIALATDCNDSNAAIHPNAIEICDGIDNDCDGQIDEGVKITFYKDADGDGISDGTTVLACSAPSQYFAAAQLTAISGDCNDNNNAITAPILYYIDNDQDGFGQTNQAPVCALAAPIGYSTISGDCNDNNNAIHPNAIEICDGIDNDCDGLTDGNDPNVSNVPTWYADADSDGYGNSNVQVQQCNMPLGYVANSTDCNDADAAQFPGQIWYVDNDNDSFGTGATIVQCTRPLNGKLAIELLATTGDCDDNNNLINPHQQYFTYAINGATQNTLITPIQASTYQTIQIEVLYFDATNAKPAATYPRAIFDYTGNTVYTDVNDRLVQLTEADANDTSTIDGKKYIGTINALPIGTSYTTLIQSNSNSCLTQIGPFQYPDIVVYPDVQIFANDIQFSSPNPPTFSPLTISANIKNVSSFNADSFVVHLRNQWDTTIIYPDIIVGSLAANSSTTIQWNIITPNTPAWCPMEVTVDYLNQINETNELDNKAIRPFINGNYNLPGFIEVRNLNASPIVATSYNPVSISIFGSAFYNGVAVPLIDSSVAGAQVTVTLLENNAVFTGITNSQGFFNIPVSNPLIPGIYHAAVHITDFTLDGVDTTLFQVIYIAPPCSTNLRAAIAIQANTVFNGYSSIPTLFAGESVNGIIHISNDGCAPSLATTFATISQTGGSFTIPNFNVPPLAPGATFTIGFSNLVFPTTGTFQICANADAFNISTESNENDNYGCSLIQVLANTVDISVNSTTNFQTYNCNGALSALNFGLSNNGAGAIGVFEVKSRIYFNGNLVDSVFNTINGISGFGQIGFQVNYPFASTGVYSVEVITDHNNVVTESNENNNTAWGNLTLLPCRPDLILLGCENFDVTAIDSTFSGNIMIKATIQNIGNAMATGPIDIRFSLSNGTIVNAQYNGNIMPSDTGIVTVNIMAPLPATANVTVEVDPNNAILEFAESNNSISNQLCWDLYPSVLCNGVSFWQQNFTKNQGVNLYVGVRNSYIYDATNVAVKFEVSGPGINGTLNLGNAIAPIVEQTCYCPATASLLYTFVFPDKGVYTFTMTVDPNGVYTECNEGNNIMVQTVNVTDQADMRVLSQYINPSKLNPNVGESVTLDISYDNIGVQNINDTMELFVQVNNTALDSAQVGGLTTYDNNTIHFNQTWSSSIPGVHIIRASIDHDNEITEANELNNEATRAIIVGELPNLYFQVFTANNLVPNNGSSIQLVGRVGNSGDSYCDASIQFSFVDNNLDSNIISTVPISVNANDSIIFSVPWLVVDNKTTIIAKIINSSSTEATYDDNTAHFVLGAMLPLYVTTPSCNGATNGVATMTPIGGEPPYSYQWSNGWSQAQLTASSGTYSVVVTDNSGQTISTNVTILNELPPAISVSSVPNTIAAGQSAILSGNGAASYSWMPGNSSAQIITVNPIVNTIYTVTGATANGCTSSATILLTVVSGLQIDSIQLVQPNCANGLGSAKIFSSNGSAPFNYSITPSLGVQNAVGSFINLPSNTYTVIASDGFGFTSSSTFVINNFTPLQVQVLQLNPQISCIANGSATLSATGIGPLLYQLGSFSNVNGSFSNLAAATYTAIVTDGSGCTATSTIVIGMTNPIQITQSIITSPNCNNPNSGSINILASGLPSITYSSVPVLPQINSGNFTQAIAGSYTIIATDPLGCTSSSVVQVNSNYPMQISTIVQSPSCNGIADGSVTLTASGGSGNISYSLSPANGLNTIPGVITNLSSGIYIAMATDAFGCSKSTVIALSQPRKLSITNIAKTNITCNGGNNGSITATATGGVGTKLFTLQPINITNTGAFNSLTAASYTLMVTDANACTRSSTVVLTQNTPIAITTVLLHPTGNAANGAIVAASTGGVGTKVISGLSNMGLLTLTGSNQFNALTAGVYTITATDSKACTTTTTVLLGSGISTMYQDDQMVTVYPNPASDFINIEGNLKQIKMYSSDGKLLLDIIPNDKYIQVDLRNYVNGYYWIKLIGQHKETIVKIVKVN